MCGTRACAARALLGLFAGAVAVAVTLDNGLHTWQDWNERRRQILSFDFGITFVRRHGTSTSTLPSDVDTVIDGLQPPP